MIILHATTRTLGALAPAQVESALDAAGAVLLRGFDVDQALFTDFTTRFSRTFVRDIGPSKSQDVTTSDEAPKVQAILATGEAQGLHEENGRTMSPPELLWFYCERPAQRGGQTTVGDGVEIWQRLASSTQARFAAEDVLYSVPVRDPLKAAALRAFLALDEAFTSNGYRFHEGEDGMLWASLQRPAVRPCRADGRLAFVNSLRGPYEGELRWQRGAAIEPALLAEIDAVYERCTLEVAWQAGDVLLVDNTRVMHGRRAFEDPLRRLHSVMGVRLESGRTSWPR